MAEKVLMRDCGDSYRRADAGSFSPAAAKTTAYTIVPSDAGKAFTNRGATASVALTLPAAKEGFFFRIEKTAAYPIVLTRAGTEGIDGTAGDLTIPAGMKGLITVACDGTDWYTTLGPGVARYTEIAISSAQITATASGNLGHASGLPLVGAPGLGLVLEFLSAVLIYDYDTAAYEGGGNVTVNWGGGGAAVSTLVSAANSLAASADNITQLVPAIAAGNALSGNLGLQLVAASAFTQPGTAAGVARVKISYRVHATGL